MADNKKNVEDSAGGRQSRKEILRARKQEEQLRSIRIVAIIVALILVGVILFALVNEFIVNPQREVATVDGEKITLQEWQDWVEFERAQRIISLDDQLEMLGNDVGMVQQFSGQTINELQSNEALGEATLNRLAQAKIVSQALAERGIAVDSAEVEKRIEEAFNYYGGDSLPPLPTPTQAPDPTPSVTPIGYEGAEGAAEVVPTNEPAPTATPVSDEAFQEELSGLMGQYRDLGVNENVYRSLVASSVGSELLVDALAEEEDLPDEEIHASAFLLNFPSEKQAQQALDEVKATDFLTVWNTINSQPPTAGEDETPAGAFEFLWQTRDTITNNVSPEAAAAIFDAPVGETSAIIELTGADGSPTYVVVMPSGLETRPLSDAELRARKVALFSAYIEEAMTEDVEIGEYWRSRVPTMPILNPKYLQPPTPTPALPEAPESDTGE